MVGARVTRIDFVVGHFRQWAPHPIPISYLKKKISMTCNKDRERERERGGGGWADGWSMNTMNIVHTDVECRASLSVDSDVRATLVLSVHAVAWQQVEHTHSHPRKDTNASELPIMLGFFVV